MTVVLLTGCNKDSTDDPKNVDKSVAAENVAEAPPALSLDPAKVGSAVVDRVGTVITSNPGNKLGAVVVLLPEDHASYQEQLEQAILMERLQNQFGLAAIVLEGATQSPKSKTKIDDESAFALLREGEISSAEFVHLMHDVPILPGESESSHTLTEPEGDLCSTVATMSTIETLVQLQGDKSKMDALKQTKAASDKNIAALMNRNATMLKQLSKPGAGECHGGTDTRKRLILDMHRALKPLVPASSQFAKTFDRACPTTAYKEDTTSLEDEIGELRPMASLAENLPSGVATGERKYLSDMIAFLEARKSASNEMVAQASALARKSKGVVVIVLGAAHTPAIVAGLRDAAIPFVHIETKARTKGVAGTKDSGRMTGGEIDRKYKQLPVRNNALNAALSGPNPDIYPVAECRTHGTIKYKPVIDLPWFERKARIYSLMNQYSSVALSSANPSPPPPSSAGWKNDISVIDVKRAAIERDPAGKPIAVIFPLILSDSQKTVWMRVTKANALAEPGDGKKPPSIEGRLLDEADPNRKGEDGRTTKEKTGEIARKDFIGFNLKAESFPSREALVNSGKSHTK